RPDLMLDVPGQSDIVVKLTPDTLTHLVGVAMEAGKHAGGGFSFSESGALLLSGDGWAVRISGSEAILAAAGMAPPKLADALNDDPALLVSLADKAGLVSLAEMDDQFQSGFMAAVTTPTGQPDSIDSNSAGAIDDGVHKRADSNDGTLLNHLDPLALPAPYFSVSVQLTTFANLFGRVNAGVGPDIAHLPPLPDEDYLNGVDPTVFTVIDPLDGAVQRPTTVTDLFTGNEDMVVSGNLAENDTLPNTGAVFAVGDLEPENGDLVLLPDGTFTFTPDPNFSGTVTFEYTITDPASGTVTVERVDIVIVPVADAPAVTAASTSTEEDTPVALPGLSAGLVDQDGSETIDVIISGVPPGASLSSGTEISPGIWSVDPVDVPNLVFTPPADFHGTIDLEITATATETANGDTAITTVPFSVVVDAQADTPSVVGGSSATDEDTPVTFGPQITYAPTDADGSEAVTEVRMTGVPAGASVTFTTAAGATVTSVAGGFSVTGSEVAIRATLDTFAITPPANSDDDFTLAVAVTVTDADGSTATQTATHPVDVTPVADAPAPVVADASGNEDTPIPLNGLGGTLADTDGSEILSYRIEGLPAGASLSAGAVQPDGSVLLTQSELVGLTITPPADFNGTIPLTLVAISTETANGDTAEASSPFNVVVAGIADAPTVSSASSSVVEDVAGVFGTDITYALTDTDGSEVISQVDVTGVPAGASVTFTPTGGATVTSITGGFSVTGSEAAIRDTLDTFAYTSAPDDDSNVTLSVAVTSTDTGGDT
ncbi:MAG: Ig-like domain-containing protein, partial [Pseudomonadota bacterium]